MKNSNYLRLLAVAALTACQEVQAPQAQNPTPQLAVTGPTQVASGGGHVNGGDRDDFQVHIHSFAFRLMQKSSAWDFDLTYHDHHEGASTTPIHHEPDAFQLRLESASRVLVGDLPNGAGRYVYIEGKAWQRMDGIPHPETNVWACMWAEDRNDGPDRFHLETADLPYGNNYTSGGPQVYLGSAPPPPPPPPPGPVPPPPGPVPPPPGPVTPPPPGPGPVGPPLQQRVCRGPNNTQYAGLVTPEAQYNVQAGNVTVR